MNNKRNIFLLIGQSNMAGRGRLNEVPALREPQISMFRDGSWIIAEEPLHTDKPEISGIGLGMSFAVEVLSHNPETAIGLIPCAVGGTPLSRWMPGADLYENALSVARQALTTNTLSGILWHQGESDSNDPTDAERYGLRLNEMITRLRADLSAENVPVIAGELGPFLQNHDGFTLFPIVNKQLRQLENTLNGYGCVSADGLTDNGDNVHFNSESLREFGHRYAKKYLDLVFKPPLGQAQR